MEKGQGKRTDTLPTDNVFTRKEYIEREAFITRQRELYCQNCDRRRGMKDGKLTKRFVYPIGGAPCRACDVDDMIDAVEDYPSADVVARECYDRLLAENDDMRAIIDTYGGLENIQSAFVKLHEIETADVRPVVRGKWERTSKSLYACSECGNCVVDERIAGMFYCPNCGADMRGES